MEIFKEIWRIAKGGRAEVGAAEKAQKAIFSQIERNFNSLGDLYLFCLGPSLAQADKTFSSLLGPLTSLGFVDDAEWQAFYTCFLARFMRTDQRFGGEDYTRVMAQIITPIQNSFLEKLPSGTDGRAWWKTADNAAQMVVYNYRAGQGTLGRECFENFGLQFAAIRNGAE